MYARRLLQILSSSKKPVHIDEIEKKLNIKERKIRETIKEIRCHYEDESFKLVTVPQKQYQLVILDAVRFNKIIEAIPKDFASNKYKRRNIILYYLLQKNSYITISELAKLIDVSVSTIRNDLNFLEKYLLEINLELKREAGRGIRVIGDERSFRKAFTKHVIHSEDYSHQTKEFFQFSNQIDEELIKEYISNLFLEYNINASDAALKSIIDHVIILIYRVDKRNFIKKIEVGEIKIPKEYFEVSSRVIKFLERSYNIPVPKEEINYLASQIAGRTMLETFDLKQHRYLEKLIIKNLKIIDKEFLTEFRSDDSLIEGLMLHLYPMLIRVVYKIELDNPLIEYVVGHYANVFLVSIKFMELIEQETGIKISENEMGYIALHFAGHLERKKRAILNSYKNIVLLNNLGRGNALLNKNKLLMLFPEANIRILPYALENMINETSTQLIISDKKIENRSSIPYILIPEILEDKDLELIRNKMILKSEFSMNLDTERVINNLLNKKLFYKTSEDDYLKIIERMSKDMIDKGYADFSFTEHVLQREYRFSTVYNNGVAGPHGLYLNAIKECVGVTLLEKPIIYNNREVKIIFLINIAQGSLFTYREISRLLMSLTNSPEQVDRIIKSKDFEEFIYHLNMIEY